MKSKCCDDFIVVDPKTNKVRCSSCKKDCAIKKQKIVKT